MKEMKEMKNIKKKVLSLALSLVLALAMVFSTFAMVQTAYADTEESTSGMVLGSDVLGNSVNTADAQTVYYAGTAWRVIAYNGTGNNALKSSTSNIMTLLASEWLSSIGNVQFSGNLTSVSGQQYSNSTLKTKIDNYWNGNTFSSLEKTAVVPRTLTGGASYNTVNINTDEVAGNTVNNASLWPLSTKEAYYLGHGNNTTGSTDLSELRKAGNHWWLRSPGQRRRHELDYWYEAAFVHSDSSVSWTGGYVNAEFGVRPAFNINLSSIMFSSLVSGTAGSAGAEYTLTLEDSSQTISISSGNTITRDSETQVTIPYTISGDSNHVSLLITNSSDTWTSGTGWSDGAQMQYYTTAAVSEVTGTVTFTIPGNFDANRNSWQAWVIPEIVNTGNYTDYAGTPLAVDIPPAHTHNFTYSASGATITATCANADGKCPLTDRKAILTIAANGGTYDGTTSFGATITDENNIQGDAKVKYQKKTGDTYGEATETAPTAAGTYKASITLGDATAFVEYTIAKADIAPEVSIEDWNYGETQKYPSVTEASNPGGGEVTYKYYTDEECTKETTSAQGALEDGGVPSYGGDYWVKATVAETDNYKSGTGTKEFTINATAITVTGLKGDSKVYDGNTDATLDTSEAQLVDVQTGDKVSIKSATGTFDNKNVGTGKTISNITIELEGDDAGGYSATADPDETVTGTITACPVTVSGITASDKTYDGTTDATVDASKAVFGGIVGDDKLSITATGAFSDANVGENKTVNLTLGALDGADKGNYKLADSGNQETAKATIKPLSMTVKADGYDGIYDGGSHSITVTVTEPTSGYTITYKGLGAEEYSEINPSFKNQGEYEVSYKVTAPNYETFTGTATVKIAKKPVTVSKIAAEDKVYDGTATAELDYNDAVLTGKLDNDDVTVSAAGAFSDKNVGEDKMVAISGIALGGDDADNYELAKTGQQETATASITERSVTVSGITAEDKVYDGNTTATVKTDKAEFENIIKGDTLTVSTTGTFDTKNVGEGKTVTFDDLILGGESVNNYELASTGQQSTTEADITPKQVNVTAEAATKVYGDDDPTEFKYTADTLLDDDKYTGSLNREAGEDVGTYEIQQGTLTAGDNYKINYTPANFTITQAGNSATASIEGWTYGDEPNDPSAKANFGEKTATFTYSNAADGEYTDTVPTDAGTWYVKATIAETDNYKGAVSKPVEFEIEKKVVELEWTDTELTYNGKEQKPKATATGLVGQDECEVTVDGAQTDANTKTGTEFYETEATKLNNPNYKLPAETKSKFTIAPKELTQAMISLDSDTIKQDGSEKGPEVTMTDADITEEDQPKQMVEGEDYTLSGDVKSSELGTHVITAEGKGNYTGSIKTSWMMYSKKSSEEKEEGTEGRGDFEVFVDVENNSSDLTVDNLTVSLANGFLTEEDMARYNEGENVLVYMIFKEQPESEVESTDSSLLGGLFRTEGATDISWYDITVWKKIGNSAAVQVHDTIDELSMGVEVPDEYKIAPEGYTREFYLGRAHDDIASILANTSKVKVGFSSSKFSTYALAYKDTKIPEPDPDKSDNPDDSDTGDNGNGSRSSKGGAKTGDSNDIAGLMTLMLASACALGAAGYRRRKETDK